MTRIWRAPSDLFLVLGTILHRRGVTALAPEAFAEVRSRAEQEARKQQPGREATLGEIYACFAASAGFEPEKAEAFAKLELSLESRSVRPIVAVRDVVRELAAARRVVLTSDSYMTATDLAAMLSRAGCGLEDIPLVVSSDHRASKRTGDLYDVVRRRFPASHYAHFGDRRRADAENAAAAGFGGFMLRGQAPTRFEIGLGAGRWHSPLAASGAQGSARAARLQGAAPDMRRRAIRAVGANVAAPILCAFVAWVLMSASRTGVRRLLFLARDGQILHRLAVKLVPALGVDIDCKYVYGSRQALYLPAVFRVGTDPWTWLCAGMPGRTVSQILDRFGLTDESTASIAGGEFHPSRVLDERLAARLQARLEDEEVSRRILDIAAERRDLVRQYYADQIGNESRVAIVDVGWKGRLQLCLQAILDEQPDHRGLQLDGYYFSLQDSAPARSSGRASTFMSYADLANPVLIEAFTMADHGSLTGFRGGAGGLSVEPVLGASADDAAFQRDVREQQAAVTDFLDCFLAGADLGGFDLARALADLRQPAIDGFTRFVRTPTMEEARVFGDFTHSDDQGHHQASLIGGPISKTEALVLVLLGSKRPGSTISYWPQASLRRLGASNPALACAIGLLGRDRALAERVRAFLRRARSALGGRRGRR
ncbi:MAG: hypothetical protein AB7S71_02180 [Dongiaceae bacterium]